jgi:hypothetical protein
VVLFKIESNSYVLEEKQTCVRFALIKALIALLNQQSISHY